jgi:hypothetical protein
MFYHIVEREEGVMCLIIPQKEDTIVTLLYKWSEIYVVDSTTKQTCKFYHTVQQGKKADIPDNTTIKQTHKFWAMLPN